MKRLIAIAALLVLMMPVSQAFAQTGNKYPGIYTSKLGAKYIGTTYSNCRAAAEAGKAALLAQDPTFIECAPGCDATYTGDFAWWFIKKDGGGSCNPYVIVQGKCETALVYDPALGLVCPKASAGTPSIPINAGGCRDCPYGFIANPVNPVTGNKHLEEVDYLGAGPFPLRLARYFNSRLEADWYQRVGRAWTHSYFRRLQIISEVNPIAVVGALRPDGRHIPFNLSGSTYKPDPMFSERLEPVAGGWQLTTDSDETELYDAAGKLLSITNRAGLTQTLTYNSEGNVATVSDPQGRSLTFTYGGTDGFIVSVTRPDGQSIAYGYDTQQRLISVTYPGNVVRGYVYQAAFNPNPRLEAVVDENGQRYTEYSFYPSAQAGSSQKAGGVERAEFGFNNPASVKLFSGTGVGITRTFGIAVNSGYGLRTGVDGLPCPSCGPKSQTYNATGNPTTRIDWNDNRTNFTYDQTRNLETQRVEALTAAGAATAQTRTINTQWHAAFRLPTALAEPLRITTNTYDADGTQCGAKGALCSRSVQPTGDANGAQGFSAVPVGAARTWAYTYNANGSVLTVNGPRTDVPDVTTYTYYANDDVDMGKRGNVATITNAFGHTTSVTAYNAHGQPLTIVDPNGLTTTLAYDARQRLTSRGVGGETTTYDYDNAGQLTKVTLPDGSFLSYSYDAAHRLTGLQDNLGNRIAYTLDLMSNRTKEEVFDPVNALVQTRSRVFSDINRLFRELGAQSQITEYTYDNQGNVTSVKDPLNRITGNQYDALNRLKQVTDPNLGVTQYGYNGLDALTSVRDPRALVTGYTVDGLGNLTQQQSPDTGTTASTYDAAGNLLTQTDAKGQTTTYSYDALNRVALITFHDGSKQAYAYDQGANGIGRLTSITESTAANVVTNVIAYAYTPHGRVSSETRTVNAVSHVNTYQYDASGRLSGMTYPSGRSVSYSFDTVGRVNQLATTKDGQTQVVVQNVQYHPFGGVKGFTLGNGQIYSRTIDLDGRIASYTLGSASYALAFDPASRITGIGANTYGYDSLDRLTSAVLPSSNFAYGYDAVGNRTSKTVGAATDTLTYSPTSNRIATLTPASGPARSFVFDSNGSSTDDGVNTYAYDTRGRMVQATSVAGATSYQVNALGQRIRKTNGAGDTVFHYDSQGKLIAESDPAGVVKRELIYLGDIPVGVVQ